MRKCRRSDAVLHHRRPVAGGLRSSCRQMHFRDCGWSLLSLAVLCQLAAQHCNQGLTFSRWLDIGSRARCRVPSASCRTGGSSPHWLVPPMSAPGRRQPAGAEFELTANTLPSFRRSLASWELSGYTGSSAKSAGIHFDILIPRCCAVWVSTSRCNENY